MADLLATLSNIGVFPVIGTILVIALLVTAFTHGGPKNGGGSDKNSKTNGGQQ